MSKTDTKFADLTETLSAARAAADAALAGADDDGTCNFDSAVLYTGRGFSFARASKKLEHAIIASGCSAWRHPRLGYIISAGIGGQGFVRTRAAEMVCDALKAAGFRAGMYYAAD